MLTTGPDIQIGTLARRGCIEVFGSTAAHSILRPESVLEPLAQAAARCSARAVTLDAYGLPEQVAVQGDTPHMQLLAEGGSHQASGAQLWAIAGVDVRPIIAAERVIGATFSDEQARYVRLSGVLPTDTTTGPGDQARQVFGQMQAALRTQQMSFRNVVRTWFYNRDILAWYDEFNAVRREFFAEQRLAYQNLPASTGVGSRPASGAALVGGLLAIEPLRPDWIQVAAIASPLQGPASDYGSAFSRAVEVVASDHRRLLISGTASIDAQGRTLHVGDVDAQIAETFEVVQKLLESRGMKWADVVRGIAYFRRGQDIPALQAYLTRQGMPAIYVLPVVATICRDELLFELEVDAVALDQGA